MNITVWAINYFPELTGIGVYNTQLCEFLAAEGHQVQIVCALPYYPSWQKFPGYAGSWCQTEQLNLVTVHRVWLYVPSKPSVIKRILHEASFVLTSFLKQLTMPRPDIYVVVSPPLWLGITAWLVSLIKRTPFVFHIQDLQPDAAVGMGMLKSKFLLKCLYGLEHFIYQQAMFISVISPQMRQCLMDKGIAEQKLIYFPNWVDLEQACEQPEYSSFRFKHGIKPDCPIVSYAGNLGVKQGLEILIKAASLLNNRNHQAVFVIAGDGAKRKHLMQLAKNLVLDNIIFVGVLPVEEHTCLLAESSICLITQRPGSGDSFMPSKLLKILSLSRPVVTNAQQGSALWQEIKKGGFGITCLPDNANDLASAIVALLDDPVRCAIMGKAGREYVTQFDKKDILSSYSKFLFQLCNSQATNIPK